MAGIISDEYRIERTILAQDPIIIAMAKGLAGVDRNELVHDEGNPRFDFMMAANAEYAARGGQLSQSIGGVAHALLSLI